MITDEMVEKACVAYAADDEVYAKSFEAMKRALEAAERAAWRPISEAPKDGQPILLATHDPFFGFGQTVGWWHEPIDGWIDGTTDSVNDYNEIHHATHFRPLPRPPQECKA